MMWVTALPVRKRDHEKALVFLPEANVDQPEPPHFPRHLPKPPPLFFCAKPCCSPPLFIFSFRFFSHSSVLCISLIFPESCCVFSGFVFRVSTPLACFLTSFSAPHFSSFSPHTFFFFHHHTTVTHHPPLPCTRQPGHDRERRAGAAL